MNLKRIYLVQITYIFNFPFNYFGENLYLYYHEYLYNSIFIKNSFCIRKRLICYSMCKRVFSDARFVCFVFLLCGMPATSTECQHPEAWPASTYGHLRGVSLTFKMFTFEKSADLLEKVLANIHFNKK